MKAFVFWDFIIVLVSRFTFVYPVVETSDANVGVPDVVVDTIITENGMG